MIEVRINGYECDPGEIEIGTAGSYGVQQLHFAFSSEWEGLTRRTTWMTDAGKIAVLLDESDTMTVPAEATATAGRRWLSVDGVAAGKQMISVRMGYKVYETVEPGGENSVTPTDEEMTQALAILEEVKALKTPEITVGKTETVECDQVIVAIGVSPNPLVPKSIKGLELVRKNTIVVDDNVQSSQPDIFAGGDIVRGGATVILAMGDGRRAAAAMDAKLSSK